MRWIAAILLVALLVVAPATQASSTESTAYNAKVIRHVFGRYGDQAVSVAWCESRLHVWSKSSDGAYWGAFQFGSYARARYGFAWNIWAQARAARAYFIDSGRTWSAWSCQP